MTAAARSKPVRVRFPAPIAWLEERQGTPYTPSHCRVEVRALQAAAKTEDLTLALTRHAHGTRLIDLLTHGAVTQLGRTSVVDFFELDCGLDARRAYEWIHFADGTTADEARHYGYSRCLAALPLVTLLGKKNLSALSDASLQLTNDDGVVESFTFTPETPVSQLDALVAQLREQATPPQEPSRNVARRARVMGEVISEFLARDEALEELQPRVTFYAGEARVQHAPMTKPAHFASMAKLCAALAKV